MTSHTHESPHEVLLSFATDAAAANRKRGNEERARLWDLEAAKLAGTIDSPAEMYRRLADIYEQGGALVVAQSHRAVADSMDRFNAAFEDAERTVRAVGPELVELRDGCVSTFVPTGPSPCFDTPEPRHWWLHADDDMNHLACCCLIGDDHVAEPRFEKEA